MVAPADAPEIGRVGQGAVDGWVSPACGGCGCLLGAELVGDGDCAETVLDVELVDAPHGWGGDRVWCELAVVEGVAEWWPSAVPAAFAGAALDPRGDAVNDGGVLELGKDAEHLQHHPPCWGAGVEWLGRRAQHDVEGVQLLGDACELADLAAEPVDAVDEQLIDPGLAGEVERGL
ncbi:MAG: hypothetical protein WA484_07890 [Solirubrobacteraceae bacterium]